MKKIVIALLGAACAACGSGGDGGQQTFPSVDEIYTGAIQSQGVSIPVSGIVDEAGHAVMIETSTPTIYNFMLTSEVEGTTAKKYTCATQSPFGVTTESDFLQVPNVVAGGALNGTLTNETSQQVVGTFSLNPQPLIYGLGASFAQIAGTYTGEAIDCQTGVTGTAASFMINISNTGSITGVDTVAGCSYSGTASIADPKKNAYEISLTPTCPSGTAAQPTTGVAAYLPNGTSGGTAQPQLLYGVFGGDGAYAMTPLTKQ